jgi:hypothetical protein
MSNSTLADKLKGIGLFKSGLVNLYHDIMQDEKSFNKSLRSGVLKYHVSEFEGKTIEELAKENGLSDKVDKYIAEEFAGTKMKLARALDLITSVKDGIEKIAEGAEAAGAVAGLALSLGAGTVAIEAGANTIEVPIYIASQALYTLVSGVLGFGSGTYTLNLEGAGKYLVDMGKGWLGAGMNMVPGFGIAEQFINWDDKRGRIQEALAERTKQYIIAEIKKKQGISLIKPGSIDDKVSGVIPTIPLLLPEYAEKTDLEPVLAEYNHAKELHPYSHDVAYGAYETLAPVPAYSS